MGQRIAPRLVACWAVCVCTAVVYQLWPFLPFARGQAHVLTGSFLGLMIAFRANTGWVCVYTSLFISVRLVSRAVYTNTPGTGSWVPFRANNGRP